MVPREGMNGRAIAWPHASPRARNEERRTAPPFAIGVGSGTLDWAKILPAARAAGVRHFYVEQEPPFTMPRIEAARKSYAFLSALRA